MPPPPLSVYLNSNVKPRTSSELHAIAKRFGVPYSTAKSAHCRSHGLRSGQTTKPDGTVILIADIRVPKPATCHPEREHLAKELCRECYDARRRKRRK